MLALVRLPDNLHLISKKKKRHPIRSLSKHPGCFCRMAARLNVGRGREIIFFLDLNILLCNQSDLWYPDDPACVELSSCVGIDAPQIKSQNLPRKHSQRICHNRNFTIYDRVASSTGLFVARLQLGFMRSRRTCLLFFYCCSIEFPRQKLFDEYD